MVGSRRFFAGLCAFAGVCGSAFHVARRSGGSASDRRNGGTVFMDARCALSRRIFRRQLLQRHRRTNKQRQHQLHPRAN